MKSLQHLFLICMGLIFFSSCITSRKAYNYVAGDATTDSRELEIMANKCKSLFPETKTPPVQAGSGVDSSDYKTAIENQNILLDQLINAQGIIDSLSGRKPCEVSPGDSARVVKNFLKQYRPAPIVKHDTTKVEVESMTAKATIAQQQQTITGLRAENAQAFADKARAEEKAKDKSKTNTWLWVVLGLLVAGNIFQFLNKLK